MRKTFIAIAATAALTLGFVVKSPQVPPVEPDEHPDPECELHWTPDVTDEEWDELMDCVFHVLGQCGKFKVDRPNHEDADHVDIHVHAPEECDYKPPDDEGEGNC